MPSSINTTEITNQGIMPKLAIVVKSLPGGEYHSETKLSIAMSIMTNVQILPINEIKPPIKALFIMCTLLYTLFFYGGSSVSRSRPYSPIPLSAGNWGNPALSGCGLLVNMHPTTSTTSPTSPKMPYKTPFL